MSEKKEKPKTQQDKNNKQLITNLSREFSDLSYYTVSEAFGDVMLTISPNKLLTAVEQLRDHADFAFEQLLDLCVVDYLHYGKDEWATKETTAKGFSRGVESESNATGRLKFGDGLHSVNKDQARFVVVYHLLSYQHNHRLRIKVTVADEAMPIVPSVIDVWQSADWYEREAFDLYGVLFEGHPDLRRILSDYGFIGHPFRKDFPLVGNVQMRYDPEKQRVIYEPVSIEPRVLVPRVIRDDNRYTEGKEEGKNSDA